MNVIYKSKYAVIKAVWLILLFIVHSVQASAQNVLSVSNIDVTVGKSAQIPVVLTNRDEIVAVQFDLSLPFDIDASKIELGYRSNGHGLSVRSLGNSRYTVIVVGFDGKHIRGNDGVLLSIPIEISREATVGQTFPVTVSNVILSAWNGDNIASGSENGVISITDSAVPDLVISDIRLSEEYLNPGTPVDVSWRIENIGEQQTEGGWSERLYLCYSAADEGTYLTAFHYTSSLEGHGIVERDGSLTIPDIPALDGNVYVKVAVVPDSKNVEPIAYRGNNTLLSDKSFPLGKCLSLTSSVSSVEESSTVPVRFSLTRSGDRSASETFRIETKGSGLVGAPESVTIPAGQSTASFSVTVIDNDEVNSVEEETITIRQAFGYEPVSKSLTIVDDEFLDMEVSFSAEELTEGETVTLTITRKRADRETVFVVRNDSPARFSHQSELVMPVGVYSASMDITAVQDNLMDVLQAVAFDIQASGYRKQTAILYLLDDDIPEIELSLTPNTVCEDAGPAAIVGTLRRLTNTDNKVTVKLSDSSHGEIYYPSQSIVLEKGVDEYKFQLGVIDNATVDGEREILITAAVYISSCGCSAVGSNAGSVQVPVIIEDNDGPSLSLTSPSTVMLEGHDDAAVLTVSRNTSTESALSVLLGSDDDSGLKYSHNVIIPAGKSSADVVVGVESNDVAGDSRTIVFTATAEGFSKGVCWLMTSDQTLPDARITELALSDNAVTASSAVKASVCLENVGAADLPARIPVRLYINGKLYETLYNLEAVRPGESTVIETDLTAPSEVGTYSISAAVNESQTVRELNYSNNSSGRCQLEVQPPFRAMVSLDREICKSGENVTITGQLIGSYSSGAEVEVYIINSGYREVISANADSEGVFAVQYSPSSARMGHFSVGACYPGSRLTEEMAAFDIYGFRLGQSSAITHNLLIGEMVHGSINLFNPGNLSVHGIHVEILSKPDDCEVSFDDLTYIGGNGAAVLKYSIKSNALSSGNDWEVVHFRIISDEGPVIETGIFYYTRSPRGKLTSSVTRINTTMVKGSKRQYPLQISNIGLGETGTVTLSLPSWMSVVTPMEIKSLAPGESSDVILEFCPSEDMQINVPVSGNLAINCKNGDGLSIGFTIEPVSEVTGSLTVDVCDENTYYTNEAPHLEGAQVVITHPTSGALVANGKTDVNGLFTKELPEGYYVLSVTADNHDSYRELIMVDPGKEVSRIVNLSIQAIQISWNVEETEVEDEYEIVTNVKYQTDVPVPVVIMNVPDLVDANSLQPGESLVFNVLMTNKGLITAGDVQLHLPDISYLEFEQLLYVEPFNLAPQQSVTIPVKVTRLQTSSPVYAVPLSIPGSLSAANAPVLSDSPDDRKEEVCTSNIYSFYYHECGYDRKWHRYEVKFRLGPCRSSNTELWTDGHDDDTDEGWYDNYSGSDGIPIMNRPNYPPNIGFSDGSGAYQPSSSSNGNATPSNENKGCEPCVTDFYRKLLDCGTNFLPFGCIKALLQLSWEIIKIN